MTVTPERAPAPPADDARPAAQPASPAGNLADHPTRGALPTLLSLAAVAGLLWWYWWLVGPQLSRPYVYDDVNFALGGRAVAQTGLPFGNQGYLLHLVEQREQWAIWHPPLYMFTLGLWVRQFGDGEVATRMLSVACQLVAAGIAFDLARRVVVEGGGSGTRALAAGMIAVAILLTNPLAVQLGQVLDIDNTLLTVWLVLFAWLATRLPGRWDRTRILGLGALFAVLLWTKLTTPWILLAALVFTRLFQRGRHAAGPLAGRPIWVRGTLDALAVGAVGSALFLVTWVGISALTGMPIEYTLTVLARETADSSLSSRDRLVSLRAFVSGVAPAVLWLGPFFCALFLMAGLPRLWSLLRGRGLVAGDLIVVLGAAIAVVYFAKLAGSLPKYHGALLPLWAAAVGILVARAAGQFTPARLLLSVATLCGLTWWLLWPMAGEWTIAWTPGVLRLLVGVPLLAGALFVAAWPFLGVGGRFGGVPVALVLLAFSWSIALDLHQRELVGSTTYYYGRYGQRSAAQVLDAALRADEVYVASKEVAWYAANRHYVDQESWYHVVWEEQGGSFDGTYFGRDIRVLALEVAEQSQLWAYEIVLERARYRLTSEQGNFRIYERAE